MENVPSIVHPSWKKYLLPLVNSAEFKFIKHVLLPQSDYLPKSEDIFNVFMMPITDIKVVILGQDPYPNKEHAMGYSFAIPNNIPKSSSLIAIDKELMNEGFDGIKYNDLYYWIEQGVFLLNTALTVKTGESGSHLVYWNDFTMWVLHIISSELPDCIWLLWGNHAKKFERYIRSGTVLKANHPQYEMRGGSGFYGCNHFKKVNEILEQYNKEIINW